MRPVHRFNIDCIVTHLALYLVYQGQCDNAFIIFSEQASEHILVSALLSSLRLGRGYGSVFTDQLSTCDHLGSEWCVVAPRLFHYLIIILLARIIPDIVEIMQAPPIPFYHHWRRRC